MDQQPDSQRLQSSKIFSVAAASQQQLDWPACDKPPHYYASQNSCNIKMVSPSSGQRTHQQRPLEPQNSLLASIQRKLFTLLYVYAILIVALYLTYAAYHFLHQNQSAAKRHQASAQELRGGHPLTAAETSANSLNDQPAASAAAPESAADIKLESKLHLLERYMELIAIDLQETKEKLKEREKCDCSISCHFNGTRYEDRSSWHSQCDVCTCQMGKISCQPRKCPQIKCDDLVTLPGQCCPTCKRQCKYNKTLYRHGEKFNPTNPTTEQPKNQTKLCQCLDGRIKCELFAASKISGLAQTTSRHQTDRSNHLKLRVNAPEQLAAGITSRNQMTDPNNGSELRMQAATSGLDSSPEATNIK